jgi:hypothetical protein
VETSLGIIAGCAATLGPLVRGSPARDEWEQRLAAEAEAWRAERRQRRRSLPRTVDSYALSDSLFPGERLARASEGQASVAERPLTRLPSTPSRVYVQTSIEIGEPESDNGRGTPLGWMRNPPSPEQPQCVVTNIYGLASRGRLHQGRYKRYTA